MKRNIAVAGAGVWGRNHIRVLGEMGRLGAVWDDDEKVREALPELPFMPFTDILCDPRIEGVVLATPPFMHCGMAGECLSFHKHVLVEKPMCDTLARALLLRKWAQGRAECVMVGHLMRYHEGFVRFVQMIHDGAVGEIEYVYANRLQPGRVRTTENSLWSLAPHDFSMIRELVGMPQSVSCVAGVERKRGVADTVTAAMKFALGASGHVFVSWLHAVKQRVLCVMGSMGELTFVDQPPSWFIYDGSKLVESGTPREPLRVELEHFVYCIDTGERARTDATEGLDVVRILDACQRSLEREGERTMVLGPQEVLA